MNYGKKRQSERSAWERSDLGNGRSDLARSDLGKMTTKFGRFWRDFYRDPIDAIARSDYARSDIGRLVTKYADFWKDFAKNPSRAIEKSDLAKSDLGRAVTRNRNCLVGVGQTAILVFFAPYLIGIPYLGPIIKVFGSVPTIPNGCTGEGDYFGR